MDLRKKLNEYGKDYAGAKESEAVKFIKLVSGRGELVMGVLVEATIILQALLREAYKAGGEHVITNPAKYGLTRAEGRQDMRYNDCLEHERNNIHRALKCFPWPSTDIIKALEESNPLFNCVNMQGVWFASDIEFLEFTKQCSKSRSSKIGN